MLTDHALKLLRRLLGSKPPAEGPHAGTPTVLDGNTAVAVTEAVVSEAAGLGATHPADGAARAWRAQQRRHGSNLAGAPLSSCEAEGPRGALAAAMGQTLAGVRSTAFLSGPDLAAAAEPLRSAAGRHLPLVDHCSLRALAAQAPTAGGGHEALHAVADSGCLQLFAANAQEAVDFALIARRAAEQALIPALVAMDGEQTARATADVRLPPAALVEQYLGSPSDEIPCPTPAQELVFGDSRQRVPRWHHPDRPVLLAGEQPPAVWGQARAASSVFFDSHLEQALEQAFEAFAGHTGRKHHALSDHHLDDAKLVLVAQGATVETAQALAERLRDSRRLKVGVLGVRCLRPFPGAEAARLLGSGARVCVLERTDSPLAGDPPLLRELRAAMDRALENGRYGGHCHPGYPALKERRRPRFLSVLYGLGGLPLRAADLQALCLEADNIRRPRIYLGLDFAPGDSPYPKRQVLLDRLRRAYPDIADLGLRAEESGPDLRPEDSVNLTIYRSNGGIGQGLAAETAALLQRLLGGGLRSRPAGGSDWGSLCGETLNAGPGALPDPGDEPTLDLALLLTDPTLPGLEPHKCLGPNAALLVQSVLPDDSLWAHLPRATRKALKSLPARLYRLPPTDDPQQGDYLLGALCGVLQDGGQIDAATRRLIGLHEGLVAKEENGEACSAAFQAGLEAPRRIAIDSLPEGTSASEPLPEDEAPALVRSMGSVDQAYDNLPRFWDQVGVLYRNGDTGQLAPDPYLALGAVPPLSGGLQDLSPLRRQIPVFDAAACSGCGACWSGCPDGAVAVSILSPAGLIDAGIAATGADVLRPLAGKLATAMADLCRNPDEATRDAAQLLNGAYARLAPRLPFPEERKAAMAQGVTEIAATLDALPLAATATFFKEAEAGSKGSGELLTLVIDPGACKGCGICARACEEQALRLQPQDPQHLQQARQLHRAWQRLPANGADSLQRVKKALGVGAAALLAAKAVSSLSGADGAEPGSAAKLVLRLALAAAHAQAAPQLAAWQESVEELRDGIGALIRGLLTDALPADDLDALSRGLESAGGQADLGDLLGVGMGAAENAVDAAVDAPRLRRLVNLAKNLGDLAWRLAEGRQGMGRAATGLVLAPGALSGWAAGFPHSPFSVPVAVDGSGDAAQLAAGLAGGWLRHATADLALMRKARLELEQPEDAARLSAQLDGLDWHGLDPEERALCPSLLLVGDAGLLAGPGLAQLHWLLNGDLPVKLLALADLDLGLAAPARQDGPLILSAPDALADLGLLALSRRNAFVAQSSPGAAEHLMQTLQQALEFPGPALLHLHAPSPARHGFATDCSLERAATAVATRTFPLFRYDPQRPGAFGSRFDLDANPEPRAPWSGEALTPALWALGEGRFAGLFSPLAEDDPEPLALAAYLELDAAGRRRHSPVVEQAANGSAPRRLRVDPALVQAAEQRQQAWRMLQELAGLVTPFTERVREEAEAAVAAERQAELEQQAADYEARIRELREQIQSENREQIRERLLQMAGYRNTVV